MLRLCKERAKAALRLLASLDELKGVLSFTEAEHERIFDADTAGVKGKEHGGFL